MPEETEVGPASEFTPGTIVGVGRYAVGNAKIPGLGEAYKALTRVLPLGRGEVIERDGRIFVR
jgi:hypothetical protein